MIIKTLCCNQNKHAEALRRKGRRMKHSNQMSSIHERGNMVENYDKTSRPIQVTFLYEWKKLFTSISTFFFFLRICQFLHSATKCDELILLLPQKVGADADPG